MFAQLLPRVTRLGRRLAQALERRLLAATKPGAPLLVAGALADLARGKPALIAENALLRQQLIVLNRQVARPRLTRRDRIVLVLLASRTRCCAGIGRASVSSGARAHGRPLGDRGSPPTRWP